MDSIETYAVIFATLMGPVFALVVARYMDDRLERKRRQRQVFETLMLTRKAVLSQDHVKALNQIELEFADDRQVLAAFRAYTDNLSDSVPEGAEAFERFMGKRRRLFVEMVQLIGQRQKFPVDKLDLMEGGYYPRGWAEVEEMGRQNSQLLRELLSGQRSLWTTSAPGAAAPPSPFPTPPAVGTQPNPFPAPPPTGNGTAA